MMDYFVSILQKAFEAFLTSLASKLAERLASPKEPRARKKPNPRRSKQRG